MIVIYNPKVPHILTVPLKGNPKKAAITGSVILRPGTNQVKDAQWEYMETILKAKIDSHEIETVTVPEKDKDGKRSAKSVSLLEMEPEEAVKMVEQCVNVETLLEWKKIPKLTEGVHYAITKQLDEIGVNTKPKKKKGE